MTESDVSMAEMLSCQVNNCNEPSEFDGLYERTSSLLNSNECLQDGQIIDVNMNSYGQENRMLQSSDPSTRENRLNDVESPPPKKRQVFDKFFKRKILDIWRNFEQYKTMNNTNINVLKKTATFLKISVASVQRVSKEKRLHGTVKRPRNRNAGRKKFILQPHFQGLIRRKILDMYAEKIFPTVLTLRQRLYDDDKNFPKISLYILRQHMKRFGFKLKKFNKKPIYMESNSVRQKRA